LSYSSPHVFEACVLQKEKHKNSWMIQLATGTKRKVIEGIKEYQFDMNGIPTQTILNILPLGSYDLLIGMDWMDAHKSKL
jgi:hypothetical protein